MPATTGRNGRSGNTTASTAASICLTILTPRPCVRTSRKRSTGEKTTTSCDDLYPSPASASYFGLKKGIVAYTAVANNVPINACNIGADDHESHFVFDILFNNGTDIQPEIHSTDTHGTNEVNFALLYPFGYRFAPRYKDLCDKVRTSLIGFNHPSRYGDAIVKPAGRFASTTSSGSGTSASASSSRWH